jgi:hypothetical protein
MQVVAKVLMLTHRGYNDSLVCRDPQTVVALSYVSCPGTTPQCAHSFVSDDLRRGRSPGSPKKWCFHAVLDVVADP